MLFNFGGGDAVKISVDSTESTIKKPIWQIGDQWSMGLELDVGSIENEMKLALSVMNCKINKLDIDGELGMYQSAIVKDDDSSVIVGGAEYICYDVYFEQYVGAVYYLDYDLELSMPDYSDDEMDSYKEEYEDDENSIHSYSSYQTSNSDTEKMIMKYKSYITLEGDITGHTYYTVDDLAIAKVDFDLWMDGYIDLVMTGNLYNEENMYMATTYSFDNINAKFKVEYDEPLDIFDFPIIPGEHWSASSKMTKTLTRITGKISYDMSINSPTLPVTQMSDNIDLGEEIETPDTYGPIQVTYYFHNPGTESIKLSTMLISECYIIEPDEEYEYDYEDTSFEDYEYDKEKYDEEEYYLEESSYSTSSLIAPMPLSIGGSGEDIFDAESIETPVESTVKSKNYFSESDGNIISYESSSEESGFAYGTPSIPTMDNKLRVTPKTYNEVSTFKSKGRAEMLSRHPRPYSKSGDGNNNDLIWTIIIISLIILFLIIVISVIAAHIIRKKKYAESSRYPYNNDHQPVTSRSITPHELSYQYSHPPKPQDLTYPSYTSQHHSRPVTETVAHQYPQYPQYPQSPRTPKPTIAPYPPHQGYPEYGGSYSNYPIDNRNKPFDSYDQYNSYQQFDIQEQNQDYRNRQEYAYYKK